MFAWKIIQYLINHNIRINPVFHVLRARNLLLTHAAHTHMYIHIHIYIHT